MLNEVHQPFELPDGTPSYKDFRHDRRLRFSTQEAASRNRIVYPTTTLHWYNAPPTMDESRLHEVWNFIFCLKNVKNPFLAHFWVQKWSQKIDCWDRNLKFNF